MYPADLVVRLFSLSNCALCISTVLLLLYLRHVNRALGGTPDEASRAGSQPWTEEELKETYQKMKQSPVDIRQHLPPKQTRRYIVTGGAGNKVGFATADITDSESTDHAFSVPWPSSVEDRPLTVFHTAATIRFAERARDLLPLSEKVNVVGTKNVLAAAKAAGASVFIATSSGSIAIRRVNFWLAPWRRWPRGFFQSLSDADYDLSRPHETYFGNYPASKATAERIVRGADNAASGIRTGVIRPASGVYGTTMDNTIGNYLRRGGNADWIRHIVNPFVYTENVSLAHLLLEQRLITPARDPASGKRVDIGGSAYTVTDPNPPIRYSDIAHLLHTLCVTPVKFVAVPPALMLVISHVVEFYTLLRHRYLPRILPPVAGDLALLQPALFAICCVHLSYDDSEARKRPEEGGLGYRAPWTSMEAMCRQVLAWNEEWNEKVGEKGKQMEGKKGEDGSIMGEVRGLVDTVEKLPMAPVQA
ncbi:hypothetical protein SLS55_001467 [Diplodia seriata]|uniref:3-beta hydroxysteroid dehydrogenase/isomerase domain-containing protein n=2 Tax=Diplodia seriata TaxID=420778 RepID=A0ABR3CPC9_9PEZI